MYFFLLPFRWKKLLCHFVIKKIHEILSGTEGSSVEHRNRIFFVRLQREIDNRYATIADETCLDRMFIYDSLASQISLEKNKNHTPPHCTLLDPICQMYVSPARTNNANNNE